MGTESCSLRAFLHEPLCKKEQAGIKLQEYLKAQTKTNNFQRILALKLKLIAAATTQGRKFPQDDSIIGQALNLPIHFQSSVSAQI